MFDGFQTKKKYRKHLMTLYEALETRGTTLKNQESCISVSSRRNAATGNYCQKFE